MSASGIELATAYISVVPSMKGGGSSLVREMGDVGHRGGAQAGGGFRSKFRSGAEGAARDTESRFASTAKKLAAGFATVFVAKKGFDLLTGTADKYKQITGEVVKLKKYMGGTTEEASRYRFIAQQSGIETEKMAKSMGIFNKNLVSGKLDDLASNMSTNEANTRKLTSAREKLATAEGKLADVRAKQAASGKHTAADEIALTNALEKVKSAQDGVTIASQATALKAKDLGLNFRDASGNLLPMSKILPGLAEKFKNMKDGPEKTALAMKLFGKSGVDLLPLLNKGKDGIGELSKKAEELGVVLGDKDVDAMKESNKNSRLWHASLESVQLQIGRYVLPILTRFTGFIASKMPPIIKMVAAGAKKISEAFGPYIDKVGPALRKVADFLTPMVDRVKEFFATNADARFAALATVIGGVVLTAVVTLGGALFAMFSPVILVVGGIALVVAGLIYAYRHFEGFRKVVDGVAKWLVSTAWPAIQSFAKLVAEGFGKMVGWVRDHWSQIKAVIAGAIHGVQVVISTVVAVIKGIWSTWGDELLSVVRIYWGYIQGMVRAAIKIVQGIIQTVMAVIHGDWGKAWEGVKKILAGVWDAIGTVVSTAIGLLKTALSAAWDAIKLAAGVAWDGIKALVPAVFDAWVGFMSALPGRLVDGLVLLGSKLLDAITAAWSFVWDGDAGVKAQFGKMVTWWKDLPGNIVTGLATLGSKLLGVLGDAWRFVWDGSDGIHHRLNGLLDWFKDLPKNAVEALATLGSKLLDALGAAWTFVWDGSDGIHHRFNGLVRWFKDLPGNIGDALGGLAETIKSPFISAFKAIAKLWNNTVGKLSFHVPSWVPEIGGMGFDVPDIPEFHTGGIVGGRSGEEVIIKALAGERVLSPAQTAAYEAGQPATTGTKSGTAGQIFGDVYLSEKIDLESVGRMGVTLLARAS